tara:strand:+ start:990 stop:1622 length:633 start_codon:yes stop_codon:yes gene_type:complete
MIIKIKKATKKDSQFFLKLRNKKNSRKFSLNKNIISKIQHDKWLSANLKNHNSFIYLITSGKFKIGYVRIEQKKQKFYISINLVQKWQNNGLSKIALRLAEINFYKIFDDRSLFAIIKKNNYKSISLFKKLNYKKIESEKNFITMKKKKSKVNYLKLISQIENIRKKNNTNWMDILKIAFTYAPEETSKLMSQIYKEDSRVSKLTKKLSK